MIGSCAFGATKLVWKELYFLAKLVVEGSLKDLGDNGCAADVSDHVKRVHVVVFRNYRPLLFFPNLGPLEVEADRVYYRREGLGKLIRMF